MSNRTFAIISWDFDGWKAGLGMHMRWIADALSATVETIVGTPAESSHSAVKPLCMVTRSFGTHLLMSFLLPFTLQRFVDKHGITELFLPSGPGGLFLLKKPKRCRVIVHSDHTYAQQSSLVPGEGWKRIFIPLEKRTLKNADLITAASVDTQKALKKDYGFNSQVIIPCSFPTHQRTKKSADTLQFLFVGSLCSRKGVEMLASVWKAVSPRALRQAQDKHPTRGSHLTIIGNGPLNHPIKDLPNSTWIPHCSHEEVYSHMLQSDVVLCPYHLEGLNSVCAEAMGCGCTVIAKNSPGLACHIEHGVTGMLVEENGVEAWTKAIEACNPEKIDTIGTAAQKFIQEEYSQSKSESVLLSALL